MTDTLPACCRLIPLTPRGDERGRLIVIEGQADVPFDIARVYFIYATTPDTTRGCHAHRALQQVAVAVSGSCTMLLDDGQHRAEVRLAQPAAITLPPMVWHEMSDFSDDCVLMVLADAVYDERDYIREYDSFLEIARA